MKGQKKIKYPGSGSSVGEKASLRSDKNDQNSSPDSSVITQINRYYL